jgi:hypothetical protein
VSTTELLSLVTEKKVNVLDGYGVHICLLSVEVPYATTASTQVLQSKMETLLVLRDRNVLSGFKK